MKMFSFTKSEIKVILFIVSVLVTGYTIKYYKYVLNGSSAVPFDFTVSDSVFIQKSGMINNGKLNLLKADSSGINNEFGDNLKADEDSLFKENKTGRSNKSDDLSGRVININTAEKVELTELPGIGESTAEKIIVYRKEKGFKKREDIMNVKGIGNKKYDKLKNYIKTE
jgi:competence ComEA-like helix-hairpin-helix protein